MRITVEGFGRRLLDLELLAPRRMTASPAVPGCDPHGTTGVQAEQAGEPAPGFGFRGSVSTVMAREPDR